MTTGRVGHGTRLVMRVVLLQAGGAVLVACVLLALSGAASAGAELAGGLIVAIGSGLFGWRMFLPGIAAAAVLKRALYAGEALKWTWYVVALWAAFARLKLAPLPLLAGLSLAQFVYWFGLVGMKRG
ncbi:MAG: ATP synthase subunit I [Gammaproteobacteria bacterium]|nr:ATP synthase subunit I [Gammaproteobacteria bacterium]